METWYILADGSLGDPAKIGIGSDGLLRHDDGRAVAYGPHGPLSRGGIDAEAERGKSKTREIKPEQPKRAYKTRDMKAD